MDKFVAQLNIEHLRKQVIEERDEPKRNILLGLLAREELVLAGLLAAAKATKEA